MRTGTLIVIVSRQQISNESPRNFPFLSRTDIISTFSFFDRFETIVSNVQRGRHVFLFGAQRCG